MNKHLVIPPNYQPILNPTRTEKAIKLTKDLFEQQLSAELRLALSAGPITGLGYLLARPSLLRFREKMSPPPAAPLLGLNGLVLKCHGGANERDFAKAIRAAADVAQSGFASEIERNMRRLPAALADAGPSAADGAA